MNCGTEMPAVIEKFVLGAFEDDSDPLSLPFFDDIGDGMRFKTFVILDFNPLED